MRARGIHLHPLLSRSASLRAHAGPLCPFLPGAGRPGQETARRRTQGSREQSTPAPRARARMCAAAHARCALRCSPSSRTPRRARPVGRGLFYRPASRLPRRPAPRRSTGAGGGGATASAPRASEDDARLPRGYRLRLAEANEVEVLHALLLAEPPGDRKGWGREQLEEEFRNTVRCATAVGCKRVARRACAARWGQAGVAAPARRRPHPGGKM